MSTAPIKVTVTGAAGHIGYALLFRIASGQMFGDRPVILQLLELEAALPALEGVAMELADCAFPHLKNIICTSDLNIAMRDTNFALLIGSVPRKAGMERADLLNINGGIFTAQGKAINQHAANDVRVLVVGNPCNTNALIAMKNAPDVPNNRFFAMTMLDELRARAQLAQKAGVDITDISNMIIWGNHSATQYPDFYNAKIKGKSVPSVIQDEQWLQNTFISNIQQRGAAILKARGLSSAASAANGVIESIRRITTETPTGEAYSMCVCSRGEYGVDAGLISSFPCYTENGEVKIVEKFSHNEFAQHKLTVTWDELRSERDAVKELGLIE